MLMRAVEGGFIAGFQVEGGNREALTVSHLLFANGTILFCDALASNVLCIHATITAIIGLMINLGKSEVVPVGDVANVDFFGCTIGL